MRTRATGSDLTTTTCLLVIALAAAACSERIPDAPPGTGPDLAMSRCATTETPEVDCAGGPRRSPFVCLRFDADCNVDVRLEDDGPWYRLEGIDGVALGGILAGADAACAPPESTGADGLPPWKRKRLAEDLPALMDGVCAPLGATADLALRDRQTGAWVLPSAVPVTEEKRAAARLCWPQYDDCGG
jgi:hypothetical protein